MHAESLEASRRSNRARRGGEGALLNWAQTSARKDVRALLAANKFRDLTIDAG
jgi:hypothetical protein